MASQNRVFVSPGVFTSERDLTFVTRQVGVTTLGMAGETTKGPAFQPVFINNYENFQRTFGGLNATKFKDTKYPQYELPYIAKSYLSQSNQLFVTRVLGLSGYDAGRAWAITLDAALDNSTTGETITTTYSGTPAFFEFSANTDTGVVSALTSNNALFQTLFDNGSLAGQLDFLTPSATGTTGLTPISFIKVSETGTGFIGVSSTFELIEKGDITASTTTTGVTSGVTIEYSGTSYTDVENKILSILRSRGRYDGDEILNFDVTGTSLGFSTTATTALTNPKANFVLTGTSAAGDVFEYNLSFDQTKRNYISRVLGRSSQDAKTTIFSETIYQNMLDRLIADGKVRGLNLDLVDYADAYDNNKDRYQESITPWIVSELRGTKLFRLFRFFTISDGDSSAKEIKISIRNIKPDTKEFDIIVRSFNDTDANPVILESFSRCSMDPTSNNFVGRKVGTKDGLFTLKSNYVMLELAEGADDPQETTVGAAFPAGFEGFPQRDPEVNSNVGVQAPCITYKKTYSQFEKKRKFYLGLSNTVGIDQDFFDYIGKPNTSNPNIWTATTNGFHMDVDASSATIDGVFMVIDNSGNTMSPTFSFDVGDSEFRTEAGTIGTSYERLDSRKFTFAPYGGFDGWDIYRTNRTFSDSYTFNGSKGVLGLTSGIFENIALSNGEPGINSDYYAYLEGIRTYSNPEATNINIFATPGITTLDNSNLVEETIEMIETERCDSLYITTTPDTIGDGVTIASAQDTADSLDGLFDSNYTATYWPWIQINDTENNVLTYVPPTRDVVRNIALTDNVAFPWFAVGGVTRGKVRAVKARVKLTQAQRDTLYEGRINPIATFPEEGVLIWGNKTLQVKESALDRINVRRLLLQARKLISAVSIRLLFEQNDDVVRNQFLSLVNPILDNIRAERGLTDFRVELDNSPESIDRNELCGKIFIKPTRALEFICVEFNLTNTGANFDDI